MMIRCLPVFLFLAACGNQSYQNSVLSSQEETPIPADPTAVANRYEVFQWGEIFISKKSVLPDMMRYAEAIEVLGESYDEDTGLLSTVVRVNDQVVFVLLEDEAFEGLFYGTKSEHNWELNNPHTNPPTKDPSLPEPARQAIREAVCDHVGPAVGAAIGAAKGPLGAAAGSLIGSGIQKACGCGRKDD